MQEMGRVGGKSGGSVRWDSPGLLCTERTSVGMDGAECGTGEECEGGEGDEMEEVVGEDDIDVSEAEGDAIRLNELDAPPPLPLLPPTGNRRGIGRSVPLLRFHRAQALHN